MRLGSTRRSRVVSRLAAVIALASIAPGPARATDSTATTISVYTCCGSLVGFSDNNPADLSSISSIYGGLLARQFPSLRWKETTFADQQTMLTRLAADERTGTPPDMVFLQGDEVGLTVLRGLAQPLDSLVTAAGASDATFLPGMARWAHFGGHWWAIPAASGPLGGQHIYLPTYLAPLGYNAGNLVRFEDYYRMSQKAVQFDATGNLTRIGYWPGIDSWESIGTLMCPPGHGLYNAADKPTATDPCNIAYLTYLKQLADLDGGYDKLRRFLAADPDFLGGSPNSYLVRGKIIIPDKGTAYWNLPIFDSSTFGKPGGVTYGLTTMPVTVHGSVSEAANYPSTQQEVIIPKGAAHPNQVFAACRAMFWQHGYLLGRAASGSPVRIDQGLWLSQLIAGEGAMRKLAGLAGNPFSTLPGIALQPKLGLLSKASNPLNPVDPYYQQQLITATAEVLLGHDTAVHALAGVQTRVLAQETRLQAHYGAWKW